MSKPENKIQIGKYTLSIEQETPDLGGGDYLLIVKEDGEGFELDIDSFEKSIDDYFKENF